MAYIYIMSIKLWKIQGHSITEKCIVMNIHQITCNGLQGLSIY